jgi:hypothetical protein
VAATASGRPQGGGCGVRQRLQGKAKASLLLRPTTTRVRQRSQVRSMASQCRTWVGGRCHDPKQCWWWLVHLVVMSLSSGLEQQHVPWASRWQLDLIGPDGTGECKPTLVVLCFPFQPGIITYFPIFIRRVLPYALLLKR